ncbi:MAG TPA: hypothetical protein VGK99_23815 [Acidobacteriota bacterium]|jgi:hypothetical protein
MKSYRVRVAGKIFENADTRVLIRRAVAARKSGRHANPCRNCGLEISDMELAHFGYCISCIERAVAILESERKVAV